MNDSAFRPRFRMTNRIEEDLDRITRSHWLIDRVLLLPNYEAWLQRDISVRRAAGTTRIEGATMDESQVSQLRRAPAGRLNEDQLANLNALRAYEFLDELSDEPEISVDEAVMRQLNRDFLRGIAPSLEPPGKYRNGQNRVGIYMPPDQGDVPALMHEFAQWLRMPNDEIHPVLRAGIAHIQFVAIHPFWNGNGRIARALAVLILQRSAYHFRKRLWLENYLYRSRNTEYIPAIERTLGTSYDPDYDATSWLEFFTVAVAQHADELQDELTVWQRKTEEIYKELEPQHISQRQADVLVFAALTGRVTRADYIEIAKVSAATASRDLNQLAKDEWFRVEGKTRDRVYVYAPLRESERPPPEQGRLFEINPSKREEIKKR